MSTPSGSLSARAGNIVSSTSGASGVPRKPLSRFGSAAVGPEPIPDGQRRRLVRSVSESAKRTSFTDRQNILLDQVSLIPLRYRA